MKNSTQVTFFVLTAYTDIGPVRYAVFLLLLLLYSAVLFSNIFLIWIIYVNRSLHEPMYMFLCSMFLNQLYGSSALFPFLLVQILSRVHTVSLNLCFLQIHCLYSYASVEFLILSTMSYDRYLAICHPLQYHMKMGATRMALLIALPWTVGCGLCLGVILVSMRLRLCGNVIPKVYCDNYRIVRLACSDTLSYNVTGLFNTLVVVLCPLVMCIFSYTKILRVCFSASPQTRKKVITTVTPHMASLVNFSFGTFFEILLSRFDVGMVPPVLRIFMSLYWLTIQPLFNPLIYGLKLTSIRAVTKALLNLKF